METEKIRVALENALTLLDREIKDIFGNYSEIGIEKNRAEATREIEIALSELLGNTIPCIKERERKLLSILANRLGLSPSNARKEIETGNVFIDGRACKDVEYIFPPYGKFSLRVGYDAVDLHLW